MKAINNIIILGFLILQIQNMEFQTNIESQSIYCISEFITENTPFHILVQTVSSQSNFTLSMLLENGSILVKKNDTSNIKKIDSYAAIQTQYRFCIENHKAHDEVFLIKFIQGIELADLSWLPKMEDAKIIERLVVLITQLNGKIKEMDDFSIKVNEYSMELQKLVSFKSVGFGFLSIGVILVISFLHYMEIKRVLRNRKII